MLCAHCTQPVPPSQRADVELVGWPFVHSKMHGSCAQLFASRWPVLWPNGTRTMPEPADRHVSAEIEQIVAVKRAEIAAWDIAPLPRVMRNNVRLVRSEWAL
jgi:hypothetical protein